MFSTRNIVVDIVILLYCSVNARCGVLRVPRDMLLLQDKICYRYGYIIDISTLVASTLSLNHNMLLHQVKNKVLQPKTETKVRKKRQLGGFMTASGMGQSKVIKLFLQMIANFFTTKYVGSKHPFDQTVPKTFVKFFRHTMATIF